MSLLTPYQLTRVVHVSAISLAFICAGVTTCFAQNIDLSEIFDSDIKENILPTNRVEFSSNDFTFQAIRRDSEQPLNKGVIYFVPDANSRFGNSSSVMRLSETLPKWGWTTILLPSAILNKQTSTENEQESNEEVNEQSQIHRKQLLTSFEMKDITQFQMDTNRMLVLAEENLKEILGHRMVIVEGISSVAIFNELNQQNEFIDAVVVSNPYIMDMESNQQIPTLISQSKIPVLDLLSKRDNQWSQATQNSRLTKSKVELKQDFRQINAYGLNGHEEELMILAKHIYGWTTYLGW